VTGRCGAQVQLMWLASTDKEFYPLLEGAKQGADRDAYIAHLHEFALHFEAEKEEEQQAK
jgi:hypothetical protein